MAETPEVSKLISMYQTGACLQTTLRLTGLAELIKLSLCTGSSQSLSVSVILCERCTLLYEIKGLPRWHTKYLKACNLLVSKAACTILLKEKALTIQSFFHLHGKLSLWFLP